MPPRKLQPHTAAGPRDITGTPLIEVPPPPEWMGEVAARMFTEIATYLCSLGAVTHAEVGLIEQYAACYSRWVAAEKALASGDPGWRSVLTRQGTEGTAVPTPAMLQMKQSLDQMRKLGAALGLAPTERARLPASRSGEPADEVESLLREAFGE
jgi:P27 family predicted phage terminase small subunit